jgi:hypothetical protein
MSSNEEVKPLWVPTLQVERMMRECKESKFDTVGVDRKTLEGLLYDSLLWRQERAARQIKPVETSWRLSAGARDVIAERLGQQKREGFTSQRDDGYVYDELTNAAIAYVLSAQSPTLREFRPIGVPSVWPDNWDEKWFKPVGPRRDLVKAAALLIAEVDRLDRAEGAPGHFKGDDTKACENCGEYFNAHGIQLECLPLEPTAQPPDWYCPNCDCDLCGAVQGRLERSAENGECKP